MVVVKRIVASAGRIWDRRDRAVYPHPPPNDSPHRPYRGLIGLSPGEDARAIPLGRMPVLSTGGGAVREACVSIYMAGCSPHIYRAYACVSMRMCNGSLCHMYQ